MYIYIYRFMYKYMREVWAYHFAIISNSGFIACIGIVRCSFGGGDPCASLSGDIRHTSNHVYLLT